MGRPATIAKEAISIDLPVDLVRRATKLGVHILMLNSPVSIYLLQPVFENMSSSL